MDYTALKALITAHEGIRSRSYKDTAGKRTVGVGFNLDAPGARQVFEALFPATSYANIYSGTFMLTVEQIAKLLDLTLNLAIDDAKDLVTSFDAQPEQVQLVLVDMVFNLGKTGLSHFVKFLAALEREDYKAAIAELQNTAWRHQVGARATDDIALLSQVANYRSFKEA
jgi:lysozyme